MDVIRNETFGPVLPLVTLSDVDEAIAYANDTTYGLTSSIYTKDLNTALRACHELHFGKTYVNRENFEAMRGFHAGRCRSGIAGADGKYVSSSTPRRISPTSRPCRLHHPGPPIHARGLQ